MSDHNTFETLDPSDLTDLTNVISIPNNVLGDIVSDLNLHDIVVTDGAEQPVCSIPEVQQDQELVCALPEVPQDQVS